jgi:[amino group carrier protein]-L-2-aminoadipate 6-kinase
MIIVKIGGGDAINLEAVARDLAEINRPFILVHGANALRDRLAKRLGVERRVLTSVKGYQSVYSDEQAIDVMMMAYSGLRNKRLVEILRRNGVNAVGLTGLDGGAVQSKRNAGVRVREDGKLKIVRDFSGKPQSVNKELFELLMNNGYAPVLTVPTIDENNVAVNSENDDVVARLHEAFQAELVIQLIEAPGYLKDADDPNSVAVSISRRDLEKIEAEADGRMKRKIHALRKLFEYGPTKVVVADGRIDEPIKNALQGKGTIII